jgi:hypothetical protein
MLLVDKYHDICKHLFDDGPQFATSYKVALFGFAHVAVIAIALTAIYLLITIVAGFFNPLLLLLGVFVAALVYGVCWLAGAIALMTGITR